MEKVAREAAFSTSKELVHQLQPTPNLEEARHRLAFTTEASRLIELRANAGVQGAHDIRPHVTRAAREGVLNPSDLLEVLSTIQSAIQVARSAAYKMAPAASSRVVSPRSQARATA